ncbi:MAG: serine/threonine protein kinase [Gemmatimonadales bacterium]|nr:serine/threonine protein kinase [Gemmatimonadales bacterium]
MRKTLERITGALADTYVIEREIGRGGMATVYLARDVKHSRQVALKVLLPELAAAVGKERFLREIGIAARLTHPNILPLHDSGEADSHLFYSMPYVDGETLRQRLERDTSLPIPEGVRILREVVDALAYAHDQGFVHRDIKPENIMLTGRHAVVTDFGVGKAITAAGDASRLTTVGTALGTPAYMAPEQAAGEANLDNRADIYALGVVAYEMFAGAAPFTGATVMQVIASHFKKIPDPLSKVRMTVPPALEQVVMKCLEKNPADRWQRAEDMLPLLEQVLAATAPALTDAVAGAERRNPLVDATFVLREEVCRRFSRERLDPRMIGDRLHYLDNQVESGVLVCYLHGMCRDQRAYERVLERSPYRGLAPTQYGFDLKAQHRIPLAMEDHVRLIWEFLRNAVERLRPSVTVLVGHSSGADLGFEMLSAPPDPPVTVDAFLSLDCNLTHDTCFVSRVLAGITTEDPARIVNDLRTVGADARTVEEWLDIHEYLVEIFRKFHGDIDVLTGYAAEVVRPFPDGDPARFVEWYRAAADQVPHLTCVFSNAESSNPVVQDLKLQNLDRGIFGSRYREGSIVLEPNVSHFDLADPDRLLSYIESVVAAVP